MDFSRRGRMDWRNGGVWWSEIVDVVVRLLKWVCLDWDRKVRANGELYKGWKGDGKGENNGGGQITKLTEWRGGCWWFIEISMIKLVGWWFTTTTSRISTDPMTDSPINPTTPLMSSSLFLSFHFIANLPNPITTEKQQNPQTHIIIIIIITTPHSPHPQNVQILP